MYPAASTWPLFSELQGRHEGVGSVVQYGLGYDQTQEGRGGA